MKSSAIFLALAIAATPALAHAKKKTPEPAPVEEVVPLTPSPEALAAQQFQTVRLGDSQLTCEQLMVEINDLSNQSASIGNGFDMAEMMPDMGSLGGGMGMGVGSMGVGLLSSFDPTGISGMVAGQAMALKAQADAAAQQKKMQEKMEAQFTGMNDKIAMQQKMSTRVQHLQGIFAQKQC